MPLLTRLPLCNGVSGSDPEYELVFASAYLPLLTYPPLAMSVCLLAGLSIYLLWFCVYFGFVCISVHCPFRYFNMFASYSTWSKENECAQLTLCHTNRGGDTGRTQRSGAGERISARLTICLTISQILVICLFIHLAQLTSPRLILLVVQRHNRRG